MLTIPSPNSADSFFFYSKLWLHVIFTFEEGVQAPPRSEPDMTLGGSLTFDTPVFNITTAMDYRFLDRADIQMGKKLHLGVEFDLPLLQLRGGFEPRAIIQPERPLIWAFWHSMLRHMALSWVSTLGNWKIAAMLCK
jgi:hypothetical protein